MSSTTVIGTHVVERLFSVPDEVTDTDSLQVIGNVGIQIGRMFGTVYCPKSEDSDIQNYYLMITVRCDETPYILVRG